MASKGVKKPVSATTAAATRSVHVRKQRISLAMRRRTHAVRLNGHVQVMLCDRKCDYGASMDYYNIWWIPFA